MVDLKLWWLALLSLFSLFHNVKSQAAPELGKLEEHDNIGCDLYLAESSIPNAGLGVYAARDFALGETIGEPSIGIPVTDMPFDATNATEIEKYGSLPEYLWESRNIGGFGEAFHVELFLPGIASLINHHSTFDNVIGSGLTMDRDLLRNSNTMAGSFTAYHGFTLLAKRPIKAGEELFVDKTSNSQRVSTFYSVTVPSAQDYADADDIVAELQTENLQTLTDAQWVDVLYRLKTEIMPETRRMVAEALPSSFEELQRAWDVGTARLPLRERTLEWVQNNGQCLDGIKEGKSTIEDAGRGAFATKTFRQGSTVSVAPMVQIPDKELFNTTHGSGDQTRQLLYNYCYGHHKSSLLLCPTTHAALINHDANKANVKMRWVRKQGTPDLTAGPIKGLDVESEDIGSYNTRLQLEFVATKHIAEGDELFLDYGQEWEDAFLRHANRGTTSSEESSYISAKQLSSRPVEANARDESITKRKHMYECNAYPDVMEVPDPGWEEFSTNQMVDMRNWPPQLVASYKDNDFASWYPCTVVEADTESELYDIELFQKPLSNKVRLRKYRNMPGDRIRLADGLYHSDQHLSWAFRQYIPIDDSIFPLRWRDDYQKADSLNLGKESINKGTAQLAEDYERSLREAKCGLYLAKSNIPKAGFGLYTAVDIPADDMVVGTVLSAVPVLLKVNDSRSKQRLKDYVWEFGQYVKNHEAGVMPMAILTGLLGGVANAHTGITNMEFHKGAPHQLLDRSSDPGAGAFSPYTHSFRSIYPINAGEELFISYGENWFLRREQFKDVPMKIDFEEADSILASIWSISLPKGAKMLSDAVGDLLRVIRELVVTEDRHRTRMALGSIPTLDDLAHAVHRNGTAAASVEARSVGWLDENGYCLDHLYVEKSTVKQAGNGAYARRAVKEGAVIISSPSLSVSRASFEKLPEASDLGIHETPIMLNYFFGHDKSSELFVPLSQALNINHASSRKRKGQVPNARVEFSSRDPRSRYLLGRTLDDIKKEKGSTVMMNFVATRDIEPDEEIFIDYGEAWEEAWDKHVREWSSRCSSRSGLCAKSAQSNVMMMNADKFNKAYHEWSDEHFTACQVGQDVTESVTAENENVVILTPYSAGSNPRSVQSYKGIGFDHEGFSLARSVKYPCHILSASKSRDEFSVLAFGLTTEQSARLLIKVENLPAEHLEFFIKPLKSDIFQPSGFRHEISIPDESFPVLWKDLE